MTEIFGHRHHPEIVETRNIHELKWLFQLDVQIITLEKWVKKSPFPSLNETSEN